MKPCPYCAEEIQDAAIKCRHCGSMLNEPLPASAAPRAPREPANVVLFSGGPSWRAQLGGHVLAAILIVGGAAAGVLLSLQFQQQPVVSGGVAAGLGVLGVIWLVSLWLKRFVHFRITTRSIDVESGLIGKRIDTIQLWKVRDLQFHQTVADRLLRLARIRVFTQDVTTPECEIWGLPGSRQIFDQLRDAMDRARQARNVIGIVE